MFQFLERELLVYQTCELVNLNPNHLKLQMVRIGVRISLDTTVQAGEQVTKTPILNGHPQSILTTCRNVLSYYCTVTTPEHFSGRLDHKTITNYQSEMSKYSDHLRPNYYFLIFFRNMIYFKLKFLMTRPVWKKIYKYTKNIKKHVL